MKNIIVGIFVTGMLFVMPSCSWVPVSVSPSNIPLEGRSFTKLERITVSDSKVRLLGLIPLSGQNRLEQALEKAKTKSGGDALTEIVVEYHYAWYILISKHSDVVTATPIRFTGTDRMANSSTINLNVTSSPQSNPQTTATKAPPAKSNANVTPDSNPPAEKAD